MKKIYITILALLVPTIVFAQSVLFPNRGGTGSESVPTTGQVLVGQSNGTYAPQATSTLGIAGGGGSGTVTQIVAGTGLSGGTITTSGTIANTGVLSLGSVTGAIATGTITCAGTASCGAGSYVLGGNLTITGAGSATGIGTSSPWTVGNLAYVSSQGAVSSVGTSTLSATSPLTGSFTQVGSGGALGIQVANTSQGGYLSNTDWNTFNGKQAALTLPLTVANGGTGVATLTGCLTGNGTGAITGSGTCNTSNATVSSVAMTTPTGLSVSGSPITTSGTLGLTLTAGYNIPLTASTTSWNNSLASTTALNGVSPVTYNASTGAIGCATCVTSNYWTQSGATTTNTVANVASTLGVFGSIQATSTATSTYAGTVNVTAGTIVNNEYQPATSSSMTLSWLNGTQQLVKLGHAAVTINFSGVVTGGVLRLPVCQDGTGGATVTWDSRVLWASSTAPTLSGANHCDLMTFDSTNGTSSLIILGGYINF